MPKQLINCNFPHRKVVFVFRPASKTNIFTTNQKGPSWYFNEVPDK